MKHACMAILYVVAATLAACASTEKGHVGVKFKKDTPFGRFEASADFELWNFSAPSDGWCGCITWIGADGEPMDVPQGVIENGKGSGRVPEGAAGWQIEITDDCDDHECHPGPKGPGKTNDEKKNSVETWLFMGQHVAFEDDGRMLDYRVSVLAGSRAQALQRLETVLEQRDTQPIPPEASIHELFDAVPHFDAVGAFEGYVGELVDDQPMHGMSVSVNGHTEEATTDDGQYTGLGWWRYDVVLDESSMDYDPSFTSSFSNTVRRRWLTDVTNDFSTEWTWIAK